ncbi:MAG TPA: APC family permease [Nannocystaceae bacterium]|nr:APC family permease [Nannocystaceae bacterium]
MDAPAQGHPKLSWREGLSLVGPDPLTSPYYSSGALILAGVGYTTPLFQLILYGILFLLAPLYIEAVLLTLSNGGTYVMTRYALSHLGKLAIAAAAVVGVVISFSYVATAIVSLLSFSDYLRWLATGLGGAATVAAIGLAAVPALGFGLWVMPDRWRQTLATVLATAAAAIALSSMFPAGVVVMLPPLVLLFTLNNYGLHESVKVSKTIFLVNLAVMGVTILFGAIHVLVHGVDFGLFVSGAEVASIPVAHGQVTATEEGPDALGLRVLPGFATLGAVLIPVALGSSILGASGVESVMNIPEELERPRADNRRIYRAMLGVLLVVGTSVSLLIFMVLPPDQLVGAAGYLVAALGHKAVSGVTGSEVLGRIWGIVIVATAALMLIAATNTGFAGARGLWVTMARDNLLPRLVLDQNDRGVFARINAFFLITIFALCYEADADIEVLERWYGASFGLVMFSGVVAFIMLRRFKGDDRRIYRAPWNVHVGKLRLPIAAIIGVVVLAFALLGLYTRFSEQIRDLQALFGTAAIAVVAILLGHNHRPLLRAAYHYFRRVIDTVESEAIETEDRTIVVAVGGVRIGRLLENAIEVARAQGKASGIPYRQIVVFHMTRTVEREYVYKVGRDSIRPSSIEGNVVRIHTELTELSPPDITMYLALVPNRHEGKDKLHAAMDSLVEFHERHGFKGHIVIIGDYGISEEDKADLQRRLVGSTLLPVPV